MSDSLNEYAAIIHKIAVEHGWWPQDKSQRNSGEAIALMHSELSEALEELRLPFAKSYFTVNNRPEGWAVELVDVMIRILDFMHAYNLDIDDIMRKKIAYNETRPYRHGGKLS